LRKFYPRLAKKNRFRGLPAATPETATGHPRGVWTGMTQPVEVLISVIIPTYNYARLLPRALDSVLAQQAADVELIVVDDGSSDDTAELLAQYATRHRRLRVIHQANAGAAAARNHGIREAHGAYALLLDADDELLPDALAHLRAVLAGQAAAGMVLGAQISVYPDGRERLRMPTAVPSASPVQLARRYLLEKRVSISHSCSLFRRDLLLQRPYPENLRGGEDVAVFAYLLVSAPVALTTAPLARIHKHADSLRHNRDNEEERALAMVSEVFSGLPAECQSLRTRYQAQRYLSLFRAALRAGDRATARRYYAAAWRLSPLQALRGRQLRKLLGLWART
jgi:glycosyltransferase involved in cell wall biosynthesis